MKQVGRRTVQHTVNSPQQGRERRVEEADHYAGRRQGQRIDTVSTPERERERERDKDRQTDKERGR